MAGVITNAGLAAYVQADVNDTSIVISHFVLAYIPDADENTEATLDQGIPNETYVVAEIDDEVGPKYNGDDAVVYSLVLSADVGDFDFNFYGIVSTAGELIAYQYIAPVAKRVGFGQVVNRNMVIRRANASTVFAADLPVESWQFNYEEHNEEMCRSIYQNTIGLIKSQKTLVRQASLDMQLSEKLRLEVASQEAEDDGTPTIETNLSLVNSTQLFSASVNDTDDDSATNEIVLTSGDEFDAVTALVENDRLQFIATATNSAAVTIQVDELNPITLVNVTVANQMFEGALVTLTYMGGVFYLTQQINPKSGNNVLDIGKLIVDTTNLVGVGEVAFNGAELSRNDHPILWAKAQATINLIDQISKDADLQTYAGYYGDGDGSDTFTLPLLGGEFIRMFDDERGVDADRVFGSWQEDAIRNITADWTSMYGMHPTEALSTGAFDTSEEVIGYMDGTNARSGYALSFDASRVVPTAAENRPRNIAYYAKTRV